MENLLLLPEEHKVVLQYKKLLECKYNVSISIPENVSTCASDIVVATVHGRQINQVKKFIQKRMDEKKQRQEQTIKIQSSVTTITLSDSDSDVSFPVQMESQLKRKKKQKQRGKKRRGAEKKSKELVDLSSTILIDSEEEANEEFVQKSLNSEKENIVKFNEMDSKINLPTEVNVESPIPTANIIPLDNTQIKENIIDRRILDDTIILCDSPPPPDFVCVGSEKEDKNIPNEIDDSIIIIEDEIPRPIEKPKSLRPVVIDGSNVARAHGKTSNTYSCKGIQIAINHFLQRGHEKVTAFVPHFRQYVKKGPVVTTDQPLLEELAKEQRVVFTPSRSYDDRFIVELATKTGGVILSNDCYKDIAGESEEFKKTIQERLLMFCFVGDMLMIPQDPLGRNGPPLEKFLSFPN